MTGCLITDNVSDNFNNNQSQQNQQKKSKKNSSYGVVKQLHASKQEKEFSQLPEKVSGMFNEFFGKNITLNEFDFHLNSVSLLDFSADFSLNSYLGRGIGFLTHQLHFSHQNNAYNFYWGIDAPYHKTMPFSIEFYLSDDSIAAMSKDSSTWTTDLDL